MMSEQAGVTMDEVRRVAELANLELTAEEEPRIRHQRAADGDHLLLTAGERRAALVAPFAQHREKFKHAPQRPRAGPAELTADT